MLSLLLSVCLLTTTPLTDADLPRLDQATQTRFYALLRSVDRLFRKEEIPYWLTGGSLLGAIRHGEMIPWDDDIDLSLFIDDLGKVISLRRALEEEGLVLLIKRDYAKIFPADGAQIPHPDGDFYLHRYPFIDLFFMTLEEGKIVHASERLRAGFENDWLEEGTAFNEKPFGPLSAPVPTTAKNYLERMYGDDCWEWAYADYNHATEQKCERVKVRLEIRGYSMR